MWEAIKDILTSANAWLIVGFLTVLVILAIVLVKHGDIHIQTKHFKLGKADEREIIRRQIERAREFVMSIEGKIEVDNQEYNGYFTKYILERVYDKTIEWIMFNHITDNRIYIEDKQDSICNLIYTFPIKDEFKTPEFNQRMRKWVEELIHQLIQVKHLYKYGGKED